MKVSFSCNASHSPQALAWGSRALKLVPNHFSGFLVTLLDGPIANIGKLKTHAAKPLKTIKMVRNSRLNADPNLKVGENEK